MFDRNWRVEHLIDTLFLRTGECALGQGGTMKLSGFSRAEAEPVSPDDGDHGTGRKGRAPHEQQDGFASIGLPPEAGWYVSAALYWIGGLAAVLAGLFSSPGTIDPVIGLLGAVTLAASPLMLLGARFAPEATWGAPVRILVPSAIFAVGAFVIGDALNALGLLFLFPLLAVAYMHRPAIAIPYCSLSLLVMDCAFLVHDSSSAGIARVITLSGVVVTLVAGLVVSQHRLRKAAAANHDLSITDPLTGLANVRGLRLRLQQELQRANRDGSELVMFAIDLDDFKEVNDRFSYALGDAVLQAVAQAIQEELEPGDLLARRGGDEFAILAIAAPGRHMARFRDRIAASIERTRRAICPDVNPRASVTRVAHEQGESAESFLRRVDDGLHMAKLDAHPERIGDDAEATGEHLELFDEEQAARMLDGARRVQLGMGGEKTLRDGGDTSLAWLMSAGSALAVATTLCLTVIPGLAPDAKNPMTLVAVLGLIVIAAGCFAASRLSLSRGWLHIPVCGIVVLTLGSVAAAGAAQYSLAELCIIPVPLAVMALGWRSAIPYVIAALAAYAMSVVGADVPFAQLQTVVLIGVAIVLTALLARGERLADKFSADAEAISVVDPLTGAANIRGFRQRLDFEVARARTTGDELCLMMIDLDRFKEVNDRYSHSMGDALLIETTRAIESVVREDELVVRRGGDEFVIVCASTHLRNMDALAVRVREAIYTARVRLTPDIATSATITSVFRLDGELSAELTSRADDALRAAKATSREPTRIAR